MRIVSTLHGSSKADLTKPRMEAINALQEAERALAKATPHGRDYATPEALDEDRQHVATQRDAIRKVIDDLTKDALDIMREFDS